MRAAINFLFCILFAFSFSSYAVETADNPGKFQLRKIPAEKINKYLTDTEFIYDRDYSPPITLWDIIKQWFNKYFLTPLFNNTSVTFWEIIEYLLIAVTMGMVIYYLVKGEKVGLFYKNSSPGIVIHDGEENIHQMNFDVLVEEAIAKGQYRLAVRHLYLKSLRELSAQHLISWKAEKTNYDYIRELHSFAFVQLFKEITLLFDYAWYGDVPITANNFEQIKRSFEKFNQQLSTIK